MKIHQPFPALWTDFQRKITAKKQTGSQMWMFLLFWWHFVQEQIFILLIVLIHMVEMTGVK